MLARRRRATPATCSTTRWRSCARKPSKRGFTTVDGVHMGPCEIHKQPRAHDRPGRLALCLPGLCRRCHAVDRPHRRPAGDRRERRGRDASTAIIGVEGMQRLRLHPGLRRRLHRRRAHRARRHEQAQLPQGEPRGRPRDARAAGCRRAHRNGQLVTSQTSHRKLRRTPMKNGKKQDKKDHAAAVARRRRRRQPALKQSPLSHQHSSTVSQPLDRGGHQ